MALMKKLRNGWRAAKAAFHAKKYTVNEVIARCPHCDCDQFEKGDTELASSLRHLVGLGWTSPGATYLMFLNCGFIMLFGGEVRKRS